MARFYDLTVTALRKTTRDAVEVTLAPRAEDRESFAFRAGQYLTFRQEIDGVELRRSYSICAGLDDGCLQVGIKQVPGGAFSTWANTALQPGDILQAMAPMGSFTIDPDPGAARRYLGFAGGSGITPVLSILRTVLSREPRARFTLIYANRGVNTIMFREEIEDLKNRYLDRFTVIHILESDAQEIDLFTGRVTEEKCKALFSHWVDADGADAAYICGPEPMMLGIARALEAHGMAKPRIKFELFASGQSRPDPRPVAADPSAPAAATGMQPGAHALRITLDGATRRIEAAPGVTVLEAALSHAIDAPYACRAGVCSTCRCKIVEGEAEMAANHALEDYEVRQGYILSCQAVPITPILAVDYDR